jgi:hypothetical protein
MRFAGTPVRHAAGKAGAAFDNKIHGADGMPPRD